MYIQARGTSPLPALSVITSKLLIVQFTSDIPKLLFVGIVERACRATVVREIPGISECFQTKDESQKGAEPEIMVHYCYSCPYRRPYLPWRFS